MWVSTMSERESPPFRPIMDWVKNATQVRHECEMWPSERWLPKDLLYWVDRCEEAERLLIDVQIVRKRSASYGIWSRIDAFVGRHREAEYR